MRINELQQSNTVASGNMFAIDTNNGTFKIDYDVLAAAIINKLGGDPVTIAHGGTGSSSASGARTNLSVYSKTETDSAIQQSTADEAKSYDITGTTWADVYSTLSKLSAGRSAVVSINGGTASLMTGGKTSFASTGVAKFVNPTNGVYEFMVMSNTSQYIYTWRITGMTSASSTPTISTVYRFSGTAV